MTGQAANPVIRGTVNAPRRIERRPGLYHHAAGNHVLRPAQSVGVGQCPPDRLRHRYRRSRLRGSARGDDVGQHAPRGHLAYDPAVSAARAVAANPATTLEDIATYYSGCRVDSLATPPPPKTASAASAAAPRRTPARALSVSVSRTSSCTGQLVRPRRFGPHRPGCAVHTGQAGQPTAFPGYQPGPWRTSTST